jgi:hypothetical protein
MAFVGFACRGGAVTYSGCSCCIRAMRVSVPGSVSSWVEISMNKSKYSRLAVCRVTVMPAFSTGHGIAPMAYAGGAAFSGNFTAADSARCTATRRA